MGVDKPFHRTVRGVKAAPNSGYSSWAFIHDQAYARSPSHYVRAYSIIQADLQRIFEFIEPSEQASDAYSYRIHELLMRTCIEVEANLKAIMSENTYSPELDRRGNPIFNMKVYKRVNISHKLSSYEVLLPIWNGPRKIWKPFEAWRSNSQLPWYQAYNASKHDRQEEFKKANLEALMFAVAGLLVVLTAQFRSVEFSARAPVMALSGYDYHEMEPAIGGLFRVKYPDDWTDAELYDFDWSNLENQAVRFQKFDYDSI